MLPCIFLITISSDQMGIAELSRIALRAGECIVLDWGLTSPIISVMRFLDPKSTMFVTL